ncbi:hypothetical protein [Neobacillus drentensis]|uniref:hypothetical protein n=1 Tax=Neobacillus drentensis TaxID=220684 RepID=UPI003000838B
MEKDLINSLKEMMGISPGSQLEMIFDSVSQVAPYVGKVITSYKIYRLEKRFKNNETRISKIERKIESSSPVITDFIKGKVFPFVLEDLLNEAQDDKIEFILNGFETVIDKKITEEDKIIAYFDVVRELRVDELKTLFNYDHTYFTLLQEKRKSESIDYRKEIESWKLNEGYYKYIKSKLSTLGLIKRDEKDVFEEIIKFVEEKFQFDERNDFLAKNRLSSKLDRKLESYELTQFGQEFINFIVNK